MPRELLDDRIKNLENEVLMLGDMVQKAALAAVEALNDRDVSKAAKISSEDHLINEKRYAIENAVLITIATQQPMAHDLRLLAAILEVISELERMGDYAKGIAKITRRLGKDEAPIPMRDLRKMVELDVDMLHRALTAFVNEDSQTASALPKEDDNVDKLYIKVYKSLMDAMIAKPKIVDIASLILWVAHNLERMGDRVTNICERTVFIATGEFLEMDSSEGDQADEESPV